MIEKKKKSTKESFGKSYGSKRIRNRATRKGDATDSKRRLQSSIKTTSAKILLSRRAEKQGIRLEDLKAKRDPTVEYAKALTKLKSMLEKENLSTDELHTSLITLKKLGMSLSQIISSIKEAKALEDKYAESYDSIIEDYKSKAEEVTRATTQLKEIELNKKKFEERISNLRDIERLQNLLTSSHVGVEAVTQYIEQYRQISEIGFNINTIRKIAEEIRRQGLDPKEAGRIIGTWLTKSETIAEALAELEQGLMRKKQEEALTISRIELLNVKVDEIQKKINALENYQITRSRALENDYEARERTLNARIAEERSRGEAEMLDILRERDKLRSENRLLKEEEQEMRSQIELAKSISTILRDPRALNTSQLEMLISEFSAAKETRHNENQRQQQQQTQETNISAISQERLIEARRILIATLKEIQDE